MMRHDGLHDLTAEVVGEGWRQTPLAMVAGGHLQIAYNTDGIAQTIVDRPAEDALSQGFEIEGDEGEELLNELDRINAHAVLINAIQWARLDGAGAILMRLRDGLALTEPMDLAKIDSILGLEDFPASAIAPGPTRYTDPALMNYGLPKTYFLTPKNGTAFEVHETRLLKVPGDTIGWTGAITHSIPWMGRSALLSCYEDLMRYRDSVDLVPLILEMKQQPISKMKGLSELLVKKLDDVVKSRLRMVDRSRSMLRTVAVDGEDSFEVADNQLAGIGETIRVLEKSLIASSKIHGAVLFGDEAKGIGNTGHADEGIYHGLLHRVQSRQAKPTLEALIIVVWAQRAFREKQPEKWRIKFKPLYSPTAKEVAEARKINAEARKTEFEGMEVGIRNHAMSGDEMREVISRDVPEWEIPSTPLPKLDPLDDPANDDPTTGQNGGAAE